MLVVSGFVWEYLMFYLLKIFNMMVPFFIGARGHSADKPAFNYLGETHRFLFVHINLSLNATTKLVVRML